MNIDSIKNGLVIDHIRAGGAMELYRLLRLGDMDCTVAIIKNAPNLENAKKFVDFMTSSEGQSLIGTQLPGGSGGLLQFAAAQHDAGLGGLPLLGHGCHSLHVVGLAECSQLVQAALTVP